MVSGLGEWNKAEKFNRKSIRGKQQSLQLLWLSQHLVGLAWLSVTDSALDLFCTQRKKSL